MASIVERLKTIQYEVDNTPHIEVNEDHCQHCADHPCVQFCPAQCFTPNATGGIDYYYVGCVECGACLLRCNSEAVKWSYPRGGFGIAYRF